MSTSTRPKLAVWKFASCDGCQLNLLDCEDELLALSEAIEIAYFREATSTEIEGPYDLSLVEGSISTPQQITDIQEVRRQSRFLVSIGACATSGGVQALRNMRDVSEFASVVYARPDYIDTLATSTPIAEHVDVDLELFGCPVDKKQLLETITAFLVGRKPSLPSYSVCVECKSRGASCVMVKGAPCLGPITRAGCGAICPAYARACYGCFGPKETPNTQSLAQQWASLGADRQKIKDAFSTFNVNAPAFKAEAMRHDD